MDFELVKRAIILVDLSLITFKAEISVYRSSEKNNNKKVIKDKAESFSIWEQKRKSEGEALMQVGFFIAEMGRIMGQGPKGSPCALRVVYSCQPGRRQEPQAYNPRS